MITIETLYKFYEKFILNEGYKLTLLGLKNTILISILGLLIGFFIGSLIATLKMIPSKNVITKIIKGV